MFYNPLLSILNKIEDIVQLISIIHSIRFLYFKEVSWDINGLHFVDHFKQEK